MKWQTCNHFNIYVNKNKINISWTRYLLSYFFVNNKWYWSSNIYNVFLNRVYTVSPVASLIYPHRQLYKHILVSHATGRFGIFGTIGLSEKFNSFFCVWLMISLNDGDKPFNWEMIPLSEIGFYDGCFRFQTTRYLGKRLYMIWWYDVSIHRWHVDPYCYDVSIILYTGVQCLVVSNGANLGYLSDCKFRLIVW